MSLRFAYAIRTNKAAAKTLKILATREFADSVFDQNN